jgi:hypothetical protein
VSDDTWPGVSRDGEPVLIRGPRRDSVQMQNQYEIRTTPLPAGARGADWRGYFSSRFTGPGRFHGWHDGNNKITIECWPDDYSEMIEKVDSAIQYANEKLRELYAKENG